MPAIMKDSRHFILKTFNVDKLSKNSVYSSIAEKRFGV